MIVELLNKNFDAIVLKLLVISIAWGFVFLAILIDLFFGIRKANKSGELRTSEGYKRSIAKFTLYYAMLAFAFFFDALIPISYFVEFPLSAIPFVTILAGLGLILTEAKSVREKAEDKHRRKVDASFIEIVNLFKDKEETLKIILETLKEKQTDEKDRINTN